MTANKRVQDTARRVVQRWRSDLGCFGVLPGKNSQRAPLLAGRKVYIGFDPDEAWL